MFAESTRCCLYERSIYLYIMNISTSVGTRTLLCPALILSFLLYYIYIQKKETLFPAHSLPFAHMFLTLIYSFIIYSIYRYREYFSATFYPFLILLLYSLYIEEGTFYPPLSPLIYTLIKWTPLYRHFPYPYSLGKVCGEKFLKTLLV